QAGRAVVPAGGRRRHTEARKWARGDLPNRPDNSALAPPGRAAAHSSTNSASAPRTLADDFANAVADGTARNRTNTPSRLERGGARSRADLQPRPRTGRRERGS